MFEAHLRAARNTQVRKVKTSTERGRNTKKNVDSPMQHRNVLPKLTEDVSITLYTLLNIVTSTC